MKFLSVCAGVIGGLNPWLDIGEGAELDEDFDVGRDVSGCRGLWGFAVPLDTRTVCFIKK